MAQQDWRGKVVQAVDELGFTANPGIYRVAFEIAAPLGGAQQSQCHLVDQCLGRGDVCPVHRHAPGLRRTGVLRVANCAAQCSGDGLPFRNGGVPRGIHGECATGGSGHPYRKCPVESSGPQPGRHACAHGSPGVTATSRVPRAGSRSTADANVVVIHTVSLPLDSG